jgi:hypothetical protein
MLAINIPDDDDETIPFLLKATMIIFKKTLFALEFTHAAVIF